MEDKKISEMAELLYKGAKMLSYYCPDCRVPLFQDNARIFCPSCGRNVIIDRGEGVSVENVEKSQMIDNRGIQQEKEGMEDRNTEVGAVKHLAKSENKSAERDGTWNRSLVEDAVKDAISKLARDLEGEEDICRIAEIVETMNKAVEILEKLRKFG
ncbi:Sjogren's syndrome/scleroderma autoantigen 1 family protein [Archaeoglobus veneficus]|uniref:Sjogrens syndrome scleroderma autoantigen 1 n=1 Tax=Archaeoglobus veneficus (strain DSM 11195 / SNP6) TaxID=693661 RepID=F2KNJ5_ARCVS|nr:Sjogren's syndrome/scleroderma autoantigen 1 family protein [Archaeoglobus veneficus]AEA46223.1 Sjogrens syndrome scleroderma autoantigen 1 [Archaeoglobus veneficus SNP6]